MKVLLAGPGIVPPWTEGRKNFVRDLAVALGGQVAVRLATTGPRSLAITEPCEGIVRGAAPPWLQPVIFERLLAREMESWRPDVVCHFPFGTFHGVRGRVNRWSMRRVDGLCARRALRCLTILYSITAGSRSTLARAVRELVLTRSGDWRGPTITLGSNLAAASALAPKQGGVPTVLFMAGSQDASALDYVFEERGLVDLVEASPRLTAGGVRLIVAIPAAEQVAVGDEIRRRFAARAPGLNLEVRAAVAVPQIFTEVDLFVFPYRRELEQFVPTSILEAMASGVAVVLSDLQMLAPLANGGCTAFVYPRANAAALGEMVTAALTDVAERRRRAAAARALVLAEWSIERSVTDLLALLRSPPP